MKCCVWFIILVRCLLLCFFNIMIFIICFGFCFSIDCIVWSLYNYFCCVIICYFFFFVCGVVFLFFGVGFFGFCLVFLFGFLVVFIFIFLLLGLCSIDLFSNKLIFFLLRLIVVIFILSVLLSLNWWWLDLFKRICLILL